MALLIRANGKTEKVQPKNGSTYSLEELQAFVGGFIELVYLDNARVMVLNEEGKLDDLPFNATATKLYDPDTTLRDYVVGDAFVCSANEIE